IPMGSKEEAERIKRKGINLEQESTKKQKSLEEITEEAMSPEEVPEEKVKQMMHLVPIEEVYVEALQVKYPIIDWKVHLEGQRSYWKIISPVFATATVVIPVTRRKVKEVMVEYKTPKKQKVQEQIDAHVAKELEEQLEKEDQRMAKQIAKDAEVARIHTEEEL
nr:hypothetical protein [Tanacetum cinerariifolium]